MTTRPAGDMLMQVFRNGYRLLAAELVKRLPDPAHPTVAATNTGISARCQPHSTRWCAICHPLTKP